MTGDQWTTPACRGSTKFGTTHDLSLISDGGAEGITRRCSDGFDGFTLGGGTL